MVRRARVTSSVLNTEQSLSTILNQNSGVSIYVSNAYPLTDLSTFHSRESIFSAAM